MARLSDGTVVHMSASIHDAESDVQQVTYVLHAPTGTSLLDVAYTGGALADRESLLFVADEASDTYDTATVVSTGASSVDVTAETRVSGVGSAATSGQSNQTLLVHLAG